MTEPQLVRLATLFIIFWVLTLRGSTNSLVIYILRSIVVIGYTLFTMEYDTPAPTLAEWVANAMVYSHWFSMVNVFLIPDPRFQKRRAYASR